MPRYLFVVPGLAGHVNPLTGVAAELEARGDVVAWAGPKPALRKLVDGGVVYPAGASTAARPPGLRGYAALKFLWEDFLVPLADSMVDGVAHAVAEFRPDVLVVDQQAFAGALVAERLGLPWVTSATTSSELADPLGALPKVAAWVDGLLDGLRSRHGVAGSGDLRFSPRLVLAFTTEAFAGPPAVRVSGALSYVGPSLMDRRDPVDFPWEWLIPGKPLVLVTLGTANGDVGGRFLNEAAIALRALSGEFQGVIADPENVLPADCGVLAVPRFPQLDLLSRAAVVLCHGGHNTVCESLSHGVPLVVAPIRDDQPILAQQVVEAGVGRRLRFDHADADAIRVALREVTGHPAYTDSARRVRQSFLDAGGAVAAADALRASVCTP